MLNKHKVAGLWIIKGNGWESWQEGILGIYRAYRPEGKIYPLSEL
jgi:hypothetical protein